MERQMRVVVAGVNYGAMYVSAVAELPLLTLAGIISRGSQRSGSFAKQYGAPLIVDIDELPENIDFACVAVGSMEAGHALARRLLGRGIHVLLEHPMQPDLLEDLLFEAKRNGVCLGLNCHLAYLEPVRKFIDASRIKSKTSNLLNAVVLSNPRLLYATLDVLGQVLPEFGNVELPASADSPENAGVGLPRPGNVDIAPRLAITPTKPGSNSNIGLASVCAQLVVGQTPVSILCSLKLSGQDDGRDQEFAPRIILTYEHGSLIFASVWGPVIWTRGTYSGEPPPRLRELLAGKEVDAEALWFGTDNDATTIDDFGAMRIEANQIALERFREQILTGQACFNQGENYLLTISELWNDLRTRISTVPV